MALGRAALRAIRGLPRDGDGEGDRERDQEGDQDGDREGDRAGDQEGDQDGDRKGDQEGEGAPLPLSSEGAHPLPSPYGPRHSPTVGC